MFREKILPKIKMYGIIGGTALYENRKVIKLLLLAVIMIASFSVQGADGEDLRKGISKLLGVIMLFGFALTVVMGIYAGILWSKGQTQEAKNTLIATAIVAAAPIIASVMYGVMGLKDSAVEVDADF